MKREAGVTLLELLIAISLVSLLSVGMLVAMRVGMNTMGAANRRVAVNRRSTGAQRILEQQLGGFLPFYAFCLAKDNPQGAKAPFFQGEPTVMQFITSYSLNEAQRGLPRIVQVFVAPGEAGDGVRLLENEHPYGGPFGAGFFCLGPEPDALTGEPVARFNVPEQQPGSFVVADKLAAARFSYQENNNGEKPDQWLPRWAKSRWPRAIRIEVEPLRPDPSRIQPVTITVPMRITREAGEPPIVVVP